MFEKLSNSVVKKIKWFGFGLLVVIYPIMAFYFLNAHSPSDIFLMGQLSFSGQVLKEYYFYTFDLDAYHTAQILDYGYMLAYGSLIFGLALSTGRAFPDDSQQNQMGQKAALMGFLAPIFDIFENAFILLTLQDPFAFPDWYAVVHSVFALIKWVLLIASILLLIPLLVQKQKFNSEKKKEEKADIEKYANMDENLSSNEELS